MKNTTGIRTFIASETIPYGARVEMGSGSVGFKLILGTASSANHLGIAQNDVTAGQALAVALTNFSGTQEIIAGSAITPGALVYPAAGGKVNVTAGANSPVGRALQASAADGDIIEVAPVL